MGGRWRTIFGKKDIEKNYTNMEIKKCERYCNKNTNKKYLWVLMVGYSDEHTFADITVIVTGYFLWWDLVS